MVGDRIATIGSPEGLANSVTDGLMSAIRRDQDINLLQITAPISPDSSGGPVFYLHGNVIAMTVAQLRGGQNLNFALPMETVQEVARQEHQLGFDQFRRVASLLGGHSHSGNAQQDVTSSSVGRRVE